MRSQTVEFRRRDSFIALLLRHQVAPETAHEIVAALRLAGANLRQVRPGDPIAAPGDMQIRTQQDEVAPIELAGAPVS